MKTLSELEYQQLTADGEVIEKHENTPKVIALPDNRYFKAFFHKSWFSASHFISRAQKFADNATKLKQCGIITVDIDQVFSVDSPKRHCVVYEGVPGITLRQALSEKPCDKVLCHQIGEYIAELHNKGVIFRSLHLGNAIVMPDGNLALIDISDMTVRNYPLLRSQRMRNFLHVMRYRQDKDLLDLDSFAEGYLAADRKHKFTLAALKEILEQTLPKAER